MSKDTKIQWCDSSLNLEIGCDGCELWNPEAGVDHCYAGTLVGRHAGKKGWPDSFAEPKIFPERLDTALRWRDLTGTTRDEKPWLDGLPRIVFLNDLGDTFTESLPVDWMAPFIPRMAASPHIWIMLTKRPKRMATFWAMYGKVPANFWLCTSVTSQTVVGRVRDLLTIYDAPVLGLSVEPLLGPVDLTTVPDLHRLQWAKIGGESGAGCRPCDTTWIRRCHDQCRDAGVAPFIKQLGGNPVCDGKPFKLKDWHGGDWDEWDTDLRVREMPTPTLCAA